MLEDAIGADTIRYVRNVTSVDRDNIVHEYQRVAGDLAELSHRWALAKAELDNAKVHMDSLAARVRDHVAAQFIAEGVAKPAAHRIESRLNGHAEIVQYRTHLVVLAVREGYLKRAIKAVELKGSMLVSLGAHDRQEREALRLTT